jgi:hypothetical protein
MKREKRKRPENTSDDLKGVENIPAGSATDRIAGEDVASEQGTETETGGQAGDLQELSRVADADSESVAELLEEGQAFEAGVVSGVENAPNADEGEVRTKEVPEDDVPPEYRKTRETE